MYTEDSVYIRKFNEKELDFQKENIKYRKF